GRFAFIANSVVGRLSVFFQSFFCGASAIGGDPRGGGTYQRGVEISTADGTSPFKQPILP
ncbi:MAG TPA: hypothetical protein VFV54_04530, partial [Thermoanaerobaculia bacterium]|nr:hypothetical protein [Thermoanaerobaculia bacterium]